MKQKIFRVQTSLLALLQNQHEFKQKTCIYSQTSRLIARRFHFYKVITNLNKKKNTEVPKVKSKNHSVNQIIMIINTTEQGAYKSKI